jgi:predicted nucleotide-binding protein (sugar kinase/HSP70/actin superfamily)
MEEFSNSQLIRRLEALGAEAWLAGIGEWVWYCNAFEEDLLALSGRRLSTAMLKARLRDRIQRADQAALFAPFGLDFTGAEEADGAEETLAASRPYLPHPGAAGEMVLSAGLVDRFFRAGVDGIIDISPFSCMNGLVSEALYPRQSRDHADLPIRVFYVDGTARDFALDLEIFLEMARSYQRIKPHPRRYPPWFEWK